ncbi:multiheme c-type cytochrome [Tundrisphaera lichenicola]|uniref:multiheme c-type cytochrome n=1 Tax=Tundrisphaera lichenicola TaxID=2029860 RepID=UPI003EBE6596
MSSPKFGVALIATLAGAGTILAAMATPGSARPEEKTARSIPWKLVGNFSCAARGCHGAVGPTDPAHGDVFIKNGSSTTWRYFDPHAKAYDVLKSERSLAMARALKDTLGGAKPHESKRCLVCHATVDPIVEDFRQFDLADGVSCEACHGPAGDWQEAHLSPSWRADLKARAEAGMTDLAGAKDRARTCTGCHVGERSEGLDVNHDLIAAGHPRLNFEYSAYLENYPKHWREKAGTDQKLASDWAVGQAVMTRAGLQLLAERAESAASGRAEGVAGVAPWPEFTETECFSCHHSLTRESWLPDRGSLSVSPPGRLPWATWTFAMLPELSKVKPGWKVDLATAPWSELKQEMTRGEPDASKVAELARKAIGVMDGWIESPETKSLTSEELAGLLKDWTENKATSPESWDQLAQKTLAISAIARAGLAQGVDPSILKMAETIVRANLEKLGFPRGFDSPLGGRPVEAP